MNPAIPAPMRTAFAAMSWPWRASLGRPSCAIPAGTSCPATTGKMASARRRPDRRGWTWPGYRPRPTSLAPTSSWTGAALSDLRRSHGYEAPHGIKFWCLGNELDGPWQICAKTAQEYGRIAQETAKLMRLVDPGVVLAACGSSHHGMPTFGQWEDPVLEHCFDEVDFISLHTYFESPHHPSAEFLANIDQMNLFIEDTVAVADSVAARKHSHKRIMLSFDEWNVWYKARTLADRRKPGWPQAPRLIEEVYNHEDALAVGGALIVMMNNADRVKTACMAQLVNVIGPIMTEPGGSAWRQTIFHPFAQASRFARGRVLRPVIRSPGYESKTFP